MGIMMIKSQRSGGNQNRNPGGLSTIRKSFLDANRSRKENQLMPKRKTSENRKDQ
jgi:hypothetical protein